MEAVPGMYDDELAFPFAGQFTRNSFTRITKGLHGRPPPSTLSIDLGDVSHAYATAVVPLISLVRHLEANGTEVDILYPFNDSYWELAGWKQLLEGRSAPPIDSRRSYVPVQAYSDVAELSDSVNAAIEVLSRHMDCSPGVLDSVAWTLNELADNVLIHAGEPGASVEGFMQVVCHPERENVALVVSDYGRGVRASLSQSHSVRDDEHALAMAIQAGVTRDLNAGQGNGLAGSVRIVSAAGGELTIMSGNAELRIVNGDTSTHVSGQVPGTSVSLVLPTSVGIDISQALWGTPPTSEFEMSHLDESDEIVFRVAEEATGFGNRQTGWQLRTKLQNLMRQFQESRVRVDFAGVALVSASFADEFIAKLVVDMGHFSFFARVRIANTNRLISQTLDNVIKQRSQPG
ncbi:MAG: DUF4325 domain-containing protein [bacterium]|nr:DUF4325 domain-containing protein [bacterium]